jgi:hypothetical protein
MDNNGAQINKAPFVVQNKAVGAASLFMRPGRNAQDINTIFMAKIFDMPFKPLLVGVACCCGYHEEVCPGVKPAQVQRNHVRSPVFLKECA